MAFVGHGKKRGDFTSGGTLEAGTGYIVSM